MGSDHHDHDHERELPPGMIEQLEIAYSGMVSFGQRPFLTEAAQLDSWKPDVAVVGAPFDVGTTNRPGARFGPRAIRATAYEPGTYHMDLGLEIFDWLEVVNFGDAYCPHGQTDVSHANIRERVHTIASRGIVPVILGDATLHQTLDDARVDKASAVAVLTENDMVNIETGIVVRESLGGRWARTNDQPGVPVVLRIFDRTLGAAVSHRFGFANVRSTVELAAPWFIGAAMGLQVFGTFSVGQRSFMVGGVRVDPGSRLDGIRMIDLATQTRVIAIARSDGTREMHPRRDTALSAGDTAYLVGPYRELLATLRQGSPRSD